MSDIIICSKDNQEIFKTSYIGEINIRGIPISCAVLDDGSCWVTQASIIKAMGKSKGGGQGRKPNSILQLEKEVGGQMPSFLSVSNLIPFMTSDLRLGGNHRIISHPKLGKIKMYSADTIPQLANLYLFARDAGVLTESQNGVARIADTIVRALASVGIQALIYEKTGYEKFKEKDSYEKTFNHIIAKELQPWTKRFPDFFWENIRKVYSLPANKKMPSYVGHLINRWIYNEISPDVLIELKKRNPSENGRRKHCHHQLLTCDVGHPTLDKQIMKINTLLSVSDSKDDFEKLFDKSKNEVKK